MPAAQRKPAAGTARRRLTDEPAYREGFSAKPQDFWKRHAPGLSRVALILLGIIEEESRFHREGGDPDRYSRFSLKDACDWIACTDRGIQDAVKELESHQAIERDPGGKFRFRPHPENYTKIPRPKPILHPAARHAKRTVPEPLPIPAELTFQAQMSPDGVYRNVERPSEQSAHAPIRVRFAGQIWEHPDGVARNTKPQAEESGASGQEPKFKPVTSAQSAKIGEANKGVSRVRGNCSSPSFALSSPSGASAANPTGHTDAAAVDPASVPQEPGPVGGAKVCVPASARVNPSVALPVARLQELREFFGREKYSAGGHEVTLVEHLGRMADERMLGRIAAALAEAPVAQLARVIAHNLHKIRSWDLVRALADDCGRHPVAMSKAAVTGGDGDAPLDLANAMATSYKPRDPLAPEERERLDRLLGRSKGGG